MTYETAYFPNTQATGGRPWDGGANLPALIKMPRLELHLHLVNGGTHVFSQDDPQCVRQVLRQINHKVFAQPSLVLHDRRQVMAYPSLALTGLSLLMDPVPPDLVGLDSFPPMQEITRADFQAKQRAAAHVTMGQPFRLLSEIEMTSGHRLWVEFQVPQAMGPLEERQMLHHAFSLPNLVCRRLGGGLSLWNRAQMVRCSFSPKPDVPGNAWPVETTRD